MDKQPKLKIGIDLLAIDKSRIIEKEFTKNDGTVVKQKLYYIEAVPKKLERTIKEGDTWKLAETHFVTNAPTKEERENGDKMTILGGATQLMNKVSTTSQIQKDEIKKILKTPMDYPEEELNPEDIPF